MKKTILILLLLVMVVSAYAVVQYIPITNPMTGRPDFVWNEEALNDTFANSTFTNIYLTFLNASVVNTTDLNAEGVSKLGQLELITPNTNGLSYGFNYNTLHLRANSSEQTTSIVFWDTPTGTDGFDRIGQIVAHGNGTAVEKNEFSFYITNATGSMQNMMKFYTNEDYSKSLVFVETDNIVSNSGEILNLGRNVSGGHSSVRLHANFDVNNSDVLNVKDAYISGSIYEIAALKGRNSGDLSIIGGTESRNINLQTRNSTDSIVSRIQILGGDTGILKFLDAYLDMNVNDIKNVSNIGILGNADIADNLSVGNTSASQVCKLYDDGTNMNFNCTEPTKFYEAIILSDVASCGSTTEGAIFYNSSDKKFYGCNSTTWNELG